MATKTKAKRRTFRLLTVAQLRRVRACRDQIVKFEATFGAAAAVTPELCRHYCGEFSYAWAADRLLSRAASRAWHRGYEAARKACPGNAEGGHYSAPYCGCFRQRGQLFARHYIADGAARRRGKP